MNPVNKMKKAAVMYDFDKTLCTRDMQEYSLIPSLGYADPSDFWREVGELSRKNHMDRILAYLYLLKQKYEEMGHPLQEKDFAALGQSIVLYPGVKTWFERVNEIGRKAGLCVEHYVISSGMSEIIEASEVAKEFTKIYACRYYYDDHGYAAWPKRVVNYTTKTQYIFRINKQVLDENDDDGLNAYVDPKHRPVPFERMIYIADGVTDIPCMKLVREYGGKSIAVYNENSRDTACSLVHDQRVDYMSPADYRAGKDMEKLMGRILDHMRADAKLADLEGQYR